MLAATTWPDVGLALVAALPGLAAAYFAFRATLLGKHTREQLRTPSGTSIGKQVEATHHTALGNNYRLQSLNNGLDVPMPDNAAHEEAQVEALNTVRTAQERGEGG